MNMIVAVALRTGSGDSYLSLFTDIESPADFVERVEENMGAELGFVYDIAVCTDCCAHDVLESALWDAVNAAGGAS